MRKILIYLFASALIVSGCYATKSDVQKGLTDTKAVITAEQTKQLEERGIQNLKKIEALNNRIDKELIPQITELQTQAYKNSHNIEKLLEEHIVALKKEIAELKSRIEALEAADKKQ